MTFRNIRPLRAFVRAFAALMSRTTDEAALLDEGGGLLKALIAQDDWLPEDCAAPRSERYAQYLLHCDSLERFSVVSFVWGPGQATPIHDHTIWGLVGVLRGAEVAQAYAATPPEGLTPSGPARRLCPGDVDAVSPRIGDIHQVSNAYDDRASVSIHVYGANIGAVRRNTYGPRGERKTFISGYSNRVTPNLWEMSPTALAPPATLLETVTPAQIRLAWTARQEVALIDLREENPYAKGHPLFAASMSLSQLELEVLDRIPRRDTPVVLYDDGEGLVGTAAERLGQLGYTQVRQLDGGLGGWREAGLELFQDVNSASKAFGELVDSRRHTPFVTALDLKDLIDNNADLVVLDARRFDEYQTMSIPGGVSAPGAELVLRARALAPDPATTIVVNCAGRTRSIIGAQSLINAGLPNPVRALRNGTIGWTLAGLELDHAQAQRAPEAERDQRDEAATRSRAAAYRAGVKRIDPAMLRALLRDTGRTLYCFDVRQPEAYASGHIPGFRGAPGGQLVQETDVFAPVRGARIVVADDHGSRADMTASWLAQMGWEVYVLDGGFDGPLETGPWRPRRPSPPKVQAMTAHALQRRLTAADLTLIDLAPSPAHRRGHIPGARFAIRAQLAAVVAGLPDERRFVLTSPDGALASWAATDLEAVTGSPPWVLEGGTDAWRDAGLPLLQGLEAPLNPPEDVYRRPYEGTDNAVEAMEAYLQWEYGLVDQLARDGTHGFCVI
jgi:predicted metal-dependent enzyme (double-stranded beta helix superfamily)/rhodanese-related sulfurtransferase